MKNKKYCSNEALEIIKTIIIPVHIYILYITVYFPLAENCNCLVDSDAARNKFPQSFLGS